MENGTVQILLVEDNSNDAELTIRALRKVKLSNYVIHLENGVEALEFLFGTGKYIKRELNNKPKVILLDLKMPKMGGLEVLAQLKTNKLTKEIPVVVLTSSAEHPDVKGAYALGANSYIVKPVEFEAFSKIIADLGFYWLLMNHHHA
jgi:two-component system response regulator